MDKEAKNYQQLTQKLRYQISGLRKAGISSRGSKDNMSAFSTVSRYTKRNVTASDPYHQ